MKFLVHVVVGPTDPTRAALALLVARSAAESGHDVSMFFAGDGVALLKPDQRAQIVGVGTGAAAEHFAALVGKGVALFASGLSAKARDISADALDGLAVTFAPPTKLVELVAAADRVLVY